MKANKRAGLSGLRTGPKRFYKEVSVAPGDGGYRVLLDGRPIRTPAKVMFVVPGAALADAVAAEWAGQDTHIDPAVMPLTRLSNTAIDRVAGRETEIIKEIAEFAASDLLCYRADHPQELADRQAAAWDVWLDWAETELGGRLKTAQGVVPVVQDPVILGRFWAVLGEFGAFPLAGLHTAVALTGSAVLGLALVRGRLDAAAAFEVAHLDDRWQAALWGEDEEAAVRLALRRDELAAAVRFLRLLDGQVSASPGPQSGP